MKTQILCRVFPTCQSVDTKFYKTLSSVDLCENLSNQSKKRINKPETKKVN